MEGKTSLSLAKEIFQSNLIGPTEISNVTDKFPLEIPTEIPTVPFNSKYLENKSKDYLLVLGISKFEKSESTLRNFKDYFGVDSKISEPCFYNQDWYTKEAFFDRVVPAEWFLIRKNLIEESRSKEPISFVEKSKLPAANKVVYAFILNWLINNEVLWKNDYVWCSDMDFNGDRIYVGRYVDPNGLNNNGFSIHRHLKIRNCYGVIDCI
jgi:hypothetical protein